MKVKSSSYNSEQFIQILPTNKMGVAVSVAFSLVTSQISATVHKGELSVPIKREDLPPVFKKITNLDLFKAFFSHAFVTIGECNNGDFTLDVNQRVMGGMPPRRDDNNEHIDDNDRRYFADTIREKLAEGKGVIQAPLGAMRPNVLIVVGSTGIGKSTLCNALNGVSLAGARGANRTFTFDTDGTAPIFPISHNPNVAGTAYPGIHSPGNSAYSYADMPGFGDPHGFVNDVVNSYFRSVVLSKAASFRILLLVSYGDIRGRGTNFKRTLADLIQFLDCRENVRRVAPAIAITVSKVQPGTPRGMVEGLLRAKLAADSPLSDNEKVLLRQILEAGRWEIFSAPNGLGANVQAEDEGLAIKQMIDNRTEQLDKTPGMAPKPAVPTWHEGTVQTAITTLTTSVINRLSADLPGLMDAHIRRLYGGDNAEQELAGMRGALTNFLQLAPINSLLETAASFNALFPLPNPLMAFVREKQEDLTFFHSLLPPAVAAIYPLRKNWRTDLNIDGQIQNRINGLTTMTAAASVEFVNRKVVVKGFFPKTSQITAKLLDQSVNNLTEIVIYGLNTVTFDDNLHHHKLAGVNGVVIAPKWKIPNPRRIVLSGRNSTGSFDTPAADGEMLRANPPIRIDRECTTGVSRSMANYGMNTIPKEQKLTVTRAEFKTYPGNGNEGKPGSPGGSGGRFWGLGRTFIGLQNLQITSDGGTGGSGQNGGGGAKGNSIPPFEPERKPWHEGGIWEVVGEKDVNTNQNHKITEVPGQQGGAGGRGGAGGLGGNKGSARIDSLVTKDILPAANGHFEDGKVGTSGTPGPGGLGGKSVQEWSGSWYHRDGKWNGANEAKLQYRGVERRGPSGASGDAQSFNTEGREKPEDKPQIAKDTYFAAFRELCTRIDNTWSRTNSQAFIQQSGRN